MYRSSFAGIMSDVKDEKSDEEKVYGGCEGPDAMYVKLVSSDGHEFIVKRDHALTSGTIKAMLSGPGEYNKSNWKFGHQDQGLHCRRAQPSEMVVYPMVGATKGLVEHRAPKQLFQRQRSDLFVQRWVVTNNIARKVEIFTYTLQQDKSLIRTFKVVTTFNRG